jgi:hypothetical protein
MKYRTKLGIRVVLFAVLALQLFPVSPAQAWFGNSQCKKAVASANKSIGDDATDKANAVGEMQRGN